MHPSGLRTETPAPAGDKRRVSGVWRGMVRQAGRRGFTHPLSSLQPKRGWIKPPGITMGFLSESQVQKRVIKVMASVPKILRRDIRNFCWDSLFILSQDTFNYWCNYLMTSINDIPKWWLFSHSRCIAVHLSYQAFGHFQEKKWNIIFPNVWYTSTELLRKILEIIPLKEEFCVLGN